MLHHPGASDASAIFHLLQYLSFEADETCSITYSVIDIVSAVTLYSPSSLWP